MFDITFLNPSFEFKVWWLKFLTSEWTWQVNAAYKKALLRYHPDRTSALAQGDPQRQVEAEETFKLITRMKPILKPSSIFTAMTAR